MNNNRLNLRIQLAGVQRQTERQETWQLANEFQFQRRNTVYILPDLSTSLIVQY
jgi:hypothetical protein